MTKPKVKRHFVVIPAYNEEQQIGNVLEKVLTESKKVIVVDDGSKDNTYEIAKQHKAISLKHKINLGKGAALKTGCEAAFRLGADAIVTLDADGQHDPKHIKGFIKNISKGDDVVFGTRNLHGNAPLVRYYGNRIGALLVKLLYGIYREDLLCGYFAFSKAAYKLIHWSSSRYGVETEIVAKTGMYKLKYSEIPIETIYLDRHKGVTLLDAISLLPSTVKWRIFR